jgi:glycosyltransferase involved in cell wall biosynthesis
LTDRRLRVAAVGVSPPNYKASGGISAGLQLMRRVADSCDAAMYVMADRDEDITEGQLKVAFRRPFNPLSALAFILPRQVTTMAWRPRIERWLESFAPDIVHIHNPHPAGALAKVAGACLRLDVPYVISTHGFVEFDDFSKGFGSPAWQKPLLERFVRRPLVEVARNAARVLMLSPYEEPILRGMGVAADRLGVVPNGVDRYFLEEPSDAERRRLVARFNLPNDRPLLLFVGNHTVNKGLDVLLKSLALMKEPAVAVIAGAIRSKAENEALIRSSGLAAHDPRFVFTDFITKEELRALYRSVDLFAFPSRADTLPLVILEAMASGLPVVATNVGGIPYEVTPEEGMLVPAGDSAALAEALDRMCNDESMRLQMASSARRRVTAHFDWEVSARLALENYETAMARGSIPSREPLRSR